MQLSDIHRVLSFVSGSREGKRQPKFISNRGRVLRKSVDNLRQFLPITLGRLFNHFLSDLLFSPLPEIFNKWDQLLPNFGHKHIRGIYDGTSQESTARLVEDMAVLLEE